MKGADFFRMIGPDILRGDGGEADAEVGDGAGVPGFADAEGIHLADLHIGGHLGRRDDDEGDIFVGVDAAGAKVVAHPHGVGAGRESHSAGERCTGGLGGIDEGFEGLGIAGDLAFEVHLEADALAVAVEEPGDDHGFFRVRAEAHGGGEGDAQEHVGGPDVAVDEGVADSGPAGTRGDFGVEAVLFAAAFFVGDDDGGAVGEGDHAEVEVR